MTVIAFDIYLRKYKWLFKKSFLFLSGAKVGNGNNVLLKIIDGTQTQINEFPWMLSLQVDLIDTRQVTSYYSIVMFLFSMASLEGPIFAGHR